MSVYLVKCRRSPGRESGVVVVSLDYQGETIHHAIDLVSGHRYVPVHAKTIYSEGEMPDHPIAVLISFRKRKDAV